MLSTGIYRNDAIFCYCNITTYIPAFNTGRIPRPMCIYVVCLNEDFPYYARNIVRPIKYVRGLWCFVVAAVQRNFHWRYIVLHGR